MLGEVDQRPSLHAETTTVVLAPDASSLGGIKSPEATVAMFWLPFSYLFFHSTLGSSAVQNFAAVTEIFLVESKGMYHLWQRDRIIRVRTITRR